MVMIARNAKTTLFASLIALLMVPLASGSTFADPTEDPRLEKIGELEDKYEKLKKATRSADKQQEYSDVLERLDLSKRWIILDNNGQGTSDEANAIAEELMESLPNEKNYVESTDADNLPRAFVTYQTTSQTRQNCHIQGTDFGSVSGSIYSSYTWSYLVAHSNYPSAIYDGNIITCSGTDFDETVVTYSKVIDPRDNCVQRVTVSSTGTVGSYCSDLTTGTLVLITANAFYDGQWFALPNAITFALI